MSRRAVSVENLCVHKHGRRILNSISLEAYEGDIVCVFGSTGSGKTTFLKTLVGLVQSLYEGFKVYGSISVYGYRPEEAVIRGLTAYVPQDVYSFFVGQTPKEELAAMGFEHISIDLGFDMGKDIYELSDGQLYRLLIVSAIAGGAKVIALDEPSSHVDWRSLEEVLSYLRDFALEKNAVLFLADHRIDKVKKFCSRYVNLDDVANNPCSLPKIASGRKGDVVVSLEDVEFCYGDNCVLRGVSVEFAKGEAVAIVGRNGVGKTTLLKVIAGIAKPSRGRVRFYGEPRVFMVPQSPVYWFPNEPLEEVVKLFIDTLAVKERVDHVLSMFKLDRYRDFDVYSLSVGLARVLSIALAYSSKADVVLIDEPTLGLDCRSKHMVIEAIDKLTSLGCSVIVATHDIDFAKLFDKVYVLNKGVLRIADEYPS